MRRGKELLIISLFVFGSFLFSGESFSKVLISKVRVSGVNTSTDEFVELFNSSTIDISLENWSLIKKTAGDSSYNLVASFPSSTFIDPFGYYLISHRDFSEAVTPDLFYSNSSYSLANNNLVLLFDPINNLADEAGWGNVTTTSGSPAVNPSVGRSLQRLWNDNGYYFDTDNSLSDFYETSTGPFNSFFPRRLVTSSTTAEEENFSTTTADSQVYDQNLWLNLKINEVLINPSTGTEWVELFNSGSSSFKFNGYLCDSRLDSCTIAEFDEEIGARNWFTIFLNSSKLNNDGDAVILKSREGVVYDSINFKDNNLLPAKDQSVARLEDGSDSDREEDWAVSEIITPGRANVIISPKKEVSLGGVGGSYIEDVKIPVVKKTPVDKISIIWNIQNLTSITVGSSVLFDSHRSADPRGGEIFYLWDFGDGTLIEGSRVYHDYSIPGIYNINVYATSTQGTTGKKSLYVKVSNEILASVDVYLSGVISNPNANEDEMISITNASSSPVDLSGWKMGGEDKWYVFPGKTEIKPGVTLKFFRSATKLVLNNEGGVVNLSLPDGKIVDILEYPKADKGKSYILTENGWSWYPKEEIIETKKSASVKVQSAKIIGVRYGYKTIPDARDSKIGEAVIVKGLVASLPGDLSANYFYINDENGGIQIYSYKKDFPKLKIGDIVEVRGEISNNQGAVRIKTKTQKDIKILGTTVLKESTVEILNLSEEHFGKLVGLEGEITERKTNYFYLDDGMAEIIVSIPKQTEATDLVEGGRIKVVGIYEKTSTGNRVFPRTEKDFEIKQEVAEKDSSRPPTNKALLGTGGGFVLIGLSFAIRKWLGK